ncbi:MAG: hypothetical protein KAS38_15570 [Anaerolineales bacterium]|nr:hypothetical protein [Anaerolineales bacterium]
MNNDKAELATSIDGYELIVIRREPDKYKQVKIIRLRLSKVGGAHVTNPDDLIRQIEDAVFLNEEGVK